ncbi:MAG: site-specific integrase [Oxalobacter formigenes]|nr:site-specific integrase [Oxalobacter formigenes]
MEAEILSSRPGEIPNKKFADLLNRYAADVSVNKKGERWERTRLKKLAAMPIGEIPLRSLKPADFVKWRDNRLKEISPASVSREMSLLSHVCTIAINEWNWLREHPMQKVRRPAASKPRDRRITDNEIERILSACGYNYNSSPGTARARAGAAFLFAIETAMRAGEIVKLAWDNVDLEKRVAQLTETKNGAGRSVPLSSEAIRILKQLPSGGKTCFCLTSSSLDALFRKAKTHALTENLHFHDTRHEAITRLAKKLDVLDLARMVGHRDLRMLMVYYNATAEELAQRLD